MDVNGIGAAQNIKQVNFGKKVDVQPKVDLSDPVDTADFSGKTAAKAEKKPASAIASFFCPGLGQLFNGNKKGAVKYFGRFVGFGILASIGGSAALATSAPAGIALLGIAGICTLVNGIQSIVNAYKGE